MPATVQTRAKRRFRLPEPPEISLVNLAAVLMGLLLAKLNPQFLETTFAEDLFDHLFLVAPRAFAFVTIYFLLVKLVVYRGLSFSLHRRMQIHLACVGFGFILGDLAFYGQIDWVYLLSAGAVMQLSALAADTISRRWLE